MKKKKREPVDLNIKVNETSPAEEPALIPEPTPTPEPVPALEPAPAPVL